MHEHSKGNTQRKMLSEATRDTHYRNLRSWSKSTPQLKLKQMEDHRRLQDHSDMTSRMTSTPEKPSISWQVITQGTLETGDEGCKSILVCTPAFTEQTFILLKQQQKKKLLISNLCFHFLSLNTSQNYLTMNWHHVVNQKYFSKIYSTNEYRYYKEPEVWGNQRVSASLARAIITNAEAICLLLETNHLRGCSFGSHWKRQRAHNGTFWLVLRKSQRYT